MKTSWGPLIAGAALLVAVMSLKFTMGMETDSRIEDHRQFMIRSAREIDYLCDHTPECKERFPLLEIPH
jgi:hypothetical protein